MLSGRHILLIITGGIAAFKALDLIRLIQKSGGSVQVIMTKSAGEFVTPLSVSTLSNHPVFTSLFDTNFENEIGHIELSRSADLIVVAPATANILAKMAHGLADDLATTCLLATDTDVLVAPAMNVRMWQNTATQRNVAQLVQDGILFVGPDEGEMACGEFGPGRLSEPADILGAISDYFSKTSDKPLAGKTALVTSGPTQEMLDPVRYLSNASSGKQGSAIARALVAAGATVTFITGPVSTPMPAGANIVSVVSAQDMLDATMAALPVDIAIFAAAVSDWRASDPSGEKIKKTGDAAPMLSLVENPDILKTVATATTYRPPLVIGFAAETENVLANAQAKLKRKGCDWVLANDVSPETGTFGGDSNTVTLLTSAGHDDWPIMTKQQVADRLVAEIVSHLGE